MRSTFLPLAQPFLGEEEIAEVADTLRSGWLTTGPKAHRLEEEFARFIGAPAALALNSCTGALHTGLAALGIGPGDAVFTTAITFAATVNVIEHVGATPVLVDVEADTLNLSPARLAEAVEEVARKRGLAGGLRPTAIMPVHLYGHPCDMEAILELASRYEMAVLEDAAHALPAHYEGRPVGTLGTLTAFSFYATKNMTTGEGGMLTGDPQLVEKARVLSLHGMSADAWKRYSAEGSWYYEVVAPGFKYNMTDIQASLGLHQLRRLPGFHRRRQEIVHRYNEAFSEVEEVQTPAERPGIGHAWHLYVLRLNLETLTIDRARFIQELGARNIGTSVHFIPIHLHPYYRDRYGYQPTSFPVAFREYQRIVSLPLYPGMSDQDVDDVIEAVSEVVRRYRR